LDALVFEGHPLDVLRLLDRRAGLDLQQTIKSLFFP
jgi:hypothetical protein